jgi:hypothetical protein
VRLRKTGSTDGSGGDRVTDLSVLGRCPGLTAPGRTFDAGRCRRDPALGHFRNSFCRYHHVLY